MAQSYSFKPDVELSRIISKLWGVDNNKCFPGRDYTLDLQGPVTHAWRLGRDQASRFLFQHVNEGEVFSRPTYNAFRALLDNYELDVTKKEKVFLEEKRECREFLTLIMETQVMREAHRYLVSIGAAPQDKNQFKELLHRIWFQMFWRSGYSQGDGNSCSFEHVFVGEGRDRSIIGLHNWLQFYLQERAGNINYYGYCSPKTVQYNEVVRLVAVQFLWNSIRGKPLCSVFIGSSPEFEIAAYTVILLSGREGKIDVQMGEYEAEFTVHSHGFGDNKKIGTAYISPARVDQYARQTGLLY